MLKVEVKGQTASLDSAIAEAARLLAAARLPLIAGLGCDVHAARQAVLLAERVGGAFDHMGSAEVLRNLEVMQRCGWMAISPGEAAQSCDVLLRVGAIEIEPRVPASARRIDVKPDEVPALRALCAGRSPARLPESAGALAGLAEVLALAKFGVATWDARRLEAAQIEMLMGLVRELNVKTRFSALPSGGQDNAPGVMQVSGWMTGFPCRVGFGRGYPDYDPWAYDARRLVESGEADGVVWLSCYRPAIPPWSKSVPTVAIVAAGAPFKQRPDVLIEVGTPGVDADSIEYRAETGGLAVVAATSPSGAPHAGDILARVAGALP